MAFQVTRRVGKYLYRYEVESYWDPDKKQPRQRTLRFLGRVDKKGNSVVKPAVRTDGVSSSFPIGSLAMFYATARELDMVTHIQDTIGVDHEGAVHILCLALNQIGQRRPLSALPAWVASSPIPGWEGIDATRLTRDSFEIASRRLCHADLKGGYEDQGLRLQQTMTKVWRGQTREPAQFYYDITRQEYYGNECDYAAPGYFPGGTKRKVIGFGMVTSRRRQHPVLCRAIRGSHNDTITVQDIVNQLKAWDFKQLTLILDRGMISAVNVDFIVQSGYDVVGIVPETNKAAWDYLVHWPNASLDQPGNIVERASGGKVYAHAWNAPLFRRKKIRLVLALDPLRASSEHLERDALLHTVEHTTDPKRLRELREDLGDLAVPGPGRRGFTIDAAAVAEDQLGDGKFLMFSTDLSLSAEQIFKIYFQRDEIEKTFHVVKGELALGPVRYRRRDRIDGYTTVVYLAYLLWSRTQERLSKKRPALTVAKALSLVADVYLVRFTTGKQISEWVSRLSTEQEEILNLVGATRFLHSG